MIPKYICNVESRDRRSHPYTSNIVSKLECKLSRCKWRGNKNMFYLVGESSEKIIKVLKCLKSHNVAGETIYSPKSKSSYENIFLIQINNQDEL